MEWCGYRCFLFRPTLPVHAIKVNSLPSAYPQELCALKDAPNISAFAQCLRECMPTMKHFTVGSIASEHVTDLLSELPRLQLISLDLTVSKDDLSNPGNGDLSERACSLIEQLQTLQHLRIDCGELQLCSSCQAQLSAVFPLDIQ